MTTQMTVQEMGRKGGLAPHRKRTADELRAQTQAGRDVLRVKREAAKVSAAAQSPGPVPDSRDPA